MTTRSIAKSTKGSEGEQRVSKELVPVKKANRARSLRSAVGSGRMGMGCGKTPPSLNLGRNLFPPRMFSYRSTIQQVQCTAEGFGFMQSPDCRPDARLSGQAKDRVSVLLSLRRTPSHMLDPRILELFMPSISAAKLP
jgi:hypothetical protein